MSGPPNVGAPDTGSGFSRTIALLHALWGLLLVALGAWFVISAVRVLPYMTSGSIYTNLPAAAFVATTTGGPLVAMGVWMLVLCRVTWTRATGMRSALLWTHGLLLPLGLLASGVGLAAMRSAAVSAERGGGLLGPIAVLPLAIGVPIVLLAAASIALAARA